MLTIGLRTPTAIELRQYQSQAAYHGRLWRLRLDRLVLTSTVCVIGSSLFALCLTMGLSWVGAGRAMQDILPAGVAVCVAVSLIALAATQRGAAAEHAELQVVAGLARAVLESARMEDVQVRLGPDDVRLDHGLGCLFLVADGFGKTVVLDVWDTGQDPRAGCLADLAPRRVWDWTRAPGTLEMSNFMAWGEREELLCWPHLDAVGREAAAAVLGVDALEDMQILPFEPIEALARLYPLTPIRAAA